jgi:NAD(P)-dependent dehydrogenase (short-subunit alcohol dehydrogenase family)
MSNIVPTSLAKRIKSQAKEPEMKEIVVVVGAGFIGQAIARRIGAGKHLVISNLTQENSQQAADALANAGFDVSAHAVDIASRESVQSLVNHATQLGRITGLVHAAGVSPSQAPIERILHVDLYGTALLLECFGEVIAEGGAGVVISSQSGHRLPALTPEQDKALAMTPTEQLLQLDMLQPGQVKDTLHAYQLSKRGNALRVMAEPCAGDSAAHESTPSAPASSSRRLPKTS